jgi:hypothetical protein
MRTLIRIGFGTTVVAVALVASGCSSDPTSSNEYMELEAERDEIVAERDQLVDNLESVRLDLAASAERTDTAETAATEVADSAAIEAGERQKVERLLMAAVDDLDSAFDLTAFDASSWLSCGDADTIAALPDDIATLREDVAAAAGWFEAAADYDTCESRRAFLAADNSILRQNNDAISESWDNWWDAEFGSDDEGIFWYEFNMWRILITLNAIEDARDVVESVVPDGIEHGEDA